jgi:hypothetical protein
MSFGTRQHAIRKFAPAGPPEVPLEEASSRCRRRLSKVLERRFRPTAKLLRRRDGLRALYEWPAIRELDESAKLTGS